MKPRLDLEQRIMQQKEVFAKPRGLSGLYDLTPGQQGRIAGLIQSVIAEDPDLLLEADEFLRNMDVEIEDLVEDLLDEYFGGRDPDSEVQVEMHHFFCLELIIYIFRKALVLVMR